MHTENKTNTVSLSVSTWVFMAFFMLSPICAAEKMDILFIAIDDMNDWQKSKKGRPPVNQVPRLCLSLSGKRKGEGPEYSAKAKDLKK